MIRSSRTFRLSEKEARLIANIFGNHGSMESDLHAEFDDHAAQWKAGTEQMNKRGPDAQRKLDASPNRRESLQEADVDRIAHRLEQKMTKGLDSHRNTLQHTAKQLQEGGQKTDQDTLDLQDEAITAIADTMTTPVGGTAFIPEAQTKSGEGVQKEAQQDQANPQTATEQAPVRTPDARGADTSSAADRSADTLVKADAEQSNRKQQTAAEQGPGESQERRA